MKIPTALGVFIVKGKQKTARDLERMYTPEQVNMHNIEVAMNPKSQGDQEVEFKKKNTREELAAANKEQPAIHADEETK